MNRIPETIRPAIEALLATHGMSLEAVLTQSPPEMKPCKRYLCEPEAENYLGQSRTGIWRAVRAGEIPVIKIGRRLMFDLKDLDAWMMSRKQVAKKRGRKRS